MSYKNLAFQQVINIKQSFFYANCDAIYEKPILLEDPDGNIL